MKAKLPYKFTNKQQKTMRDEINREIIKRNHKFDIDFEAMIAWTLHKHFGFGLTRLLRFRKAFISEYKELTEHYQMDDAYPARYLLKNNVGYDVEKLLREDEENGW